MGGKLRVYRLTPIGNVGVPIYKASDLRACVTLCRPFVLAGYGLSSFGNYSRADPKDWRFEALRPDGSWAVLHEVRDFIFHGRIESALFYPKPAEVMAAATYRWVFTRMNAMVGLFGFVNPVLLTAEPGVAVAGTAKVIGEAIRAAGEAVTRVAAEAGAGVDRLIVPRSEQGYVWWKLKGREGVKGSLPLRSYSLSAVGSESAPVSWVLEGLTTEY